MFKFEFKFYVVDVVKVLSTVTIAVLICIEKVLLPSRKFLLVLWLPGGSHLQIETCIICCGVTLKKCPKSTFFRSFFFGIAGFNFERIFEFLVQFYEAKP